MMICSHTLPVTPTGGLATSLLVPMPRDISVEHQATFTPLPSSTPKKCLTRPPLRRRLTQPLLLITLSEMPLVSFSITMLSLELLNRPSLTTIIDVFTKAWNGTTRNTTRLFKTESRWKLAFNRINLGSNVCRPTQPIWNARLGP